jgi:hypothetical protein
MMVPKYAQKQPKKKGEPNCVKTWQWSPHAPKNNKQKGLKKKGNWAPSLMKVDDGAHMHPQAIKHKEKIKKKEGA